MTKKEEKEQKALAKLEAERARIETMKEFEYKFADKKYICGIDEVGRGPFAGPVVAGAVILPKDEEILYLNDSKKLSEKKREELYDIIMDKAVAVGFGMEDSGVIDEINIKQATLKAMKKAIENLKNPKTGAASIVAKVTRDRMMVEYDSIYPGYDFASNKGYGTAAHMAAIRELGMTPIHRRSFIHLN